MSVADFPESHRSVAPQCNQDLTFYALNGPARRRLLIALATGGPKSGAELMHAGKGRGTCTAPRNYLDSALKHLKLMIEAGMVVQLENPVDGRRPLYALSPRLKVSIDADKTIINFGFCVVRLSQDGN